jgi:hypothetical protein
MAFLGRRGDILDSTALEGRRALTAGELPASLRFWMPQMGQEECLAEAVTVVAARRSLPSGPDGTLWWEGGRKLVPYWRSDTSRARRPTFQRYMVCRASGRGGSDRHTLIGQ